MFHFFNLLIFKNTEKVLYVKDKWLINFIQKAAIDFDFFSVHFTREKNQVYVSLEI